MYFKSNQRVPIKTINVELLHQNLASHLDCKVVHGIFTAPKMNFHLVFSAQITVPQNSNGNGLVYHPFDIQSHEGLQVFLWGEIGCQPIEGAQLSPPLISPTQPMNVKG